MPLLDLQRSLRRLGKLRLGETRTSQNGKTYPAKLTDWRITSPSRDLMERVATRYGGEVSEWLEAPAGHGKQWEVLTETDTLEVIIPPGDAACSQWNEMWSGGGCQRRCDGFTETLSDAKCLCPSDQEERAKLAAKGDACKPTTRLSVILPEIPDIGTWMLESHGYYAAVELGGAIEVLRMASATGNLIPGRLRIDQRSVKRPGKDGKPETRNYIVPVLELPTLTAQMLMTGEVTTTALDGAPAAALPEPKPPAIEPPKAEPAKSQVRRPTRRPPLPGEDDAPAGSRDAPADEGGEGVRSASGTSPSVLASDTERGAALARINKLNPADMRKCMDVLKASYGPPDQWQAKDQGNISDAIAAYEGAGL